MDRFTNLDTVKKTVGEATGLPNAHYIDTQVFNQEREAVLFATWAGVGFAKDIPEPGDARPFDFLGMPLLMMRDKKGQLGVFQNTCRHRGMTLLQAPKKLHNTIRCPYHSWCYSLNGELTATPHVGGSGIHTHELIKPSQLGLFRIRSHVWQDIVFINTSGDAPDFDIAHANLLDRWKEFNQPLFHGGGSSSFKLEVNTNWKLAVENYCESYHLPWIHPELNRYSKLEDHYNIQRLGAYSGQGTHVYKQLKGANNETFDDFKGLSARWDTGAEYIAIYPNVLFGVHRDHYHAIVLEPIGCDKTIEHIELYYATDPNTQPELQALRNANAAQWKAVFEEDIEVVEGMQRGRHGVLFDGGHFSPAMDGPTHNFHHWIATQIDNARRS